MVKEGDTVISIYDNIPYFHKGEYFIVDGLSNQIGHWYYTLDSVSDRHHESFFEKVSIIELRELKFKKLFNVKSNKK